MIMVLKYSVGIFVILTTSHGLDINGLRNTPNFYSPAFPQRGPYNSQIFSTSRPFNQKVNVDNSPANYEFNYAINDEQTGDVKSHKENRRGDLTVGRYEVLDPDGYKRIVEYTVDGLSGFRATVRRIRIEGSARPPNINLIRPGPGYISNSNRQNSSPNRIQLQTQSQNLPDDVVELINPEYQFPSNNRRLPSSNINFRQSFQQ